MEANMLEEDIFIESLSKVFYEQLSAIKCENIYIKKDIKIFELSKIINNNEYSKIVIDNILKKLNFNAKSIKIENSRKDDMYRINHILFTFILGLYICEFCNLKKLIENKYKQYFEKNEKNVFLKVWLLASLYHDYGYFKYKDYDGGTEIINSLNDIICDNNIFNYIENERTKEKLRYSKKTIENYFLYNLKYDKNEKYEHGILGGYTLFDELIIDSSNTSLKFKNNDLFCNICFRIMEHNIWKLDDERIKDLKKNCKEKIKFDNKIKKELEEIYNDNFKKVKLEELLLFLLSLCDTIEYIKKIDKFTDYGNIDSNNSTMEHRITTILKYIFISSEEKTIVIECSNFENDNYIKFNYINWLESLILLNDWVEVKCVFIEKENKVKIYVD